MLTIEEIKKACEFAEGFTVHGLGVNCLGYESFMTRELSGESKDDGAKRLWIEVYYPLFLQRVLEGINYSELVYCINQDQSGLRVWNDEKKRGENFYLWDHESFDQAKEQAIKYILGRLV